MKIKFGIQRRHSAKDNLFIIKIGIKQIDIEKCKLEKGVYKYYSKLYYFKGIYAKLNLDIKRKALKSPEQEKITGDNNENFQLIINGSSLDLQLTYNRSVKDLSEILSDDYKNYIIKHSKAGNYYLLRLVCFIPTDVIQYITPNQAYDRPAQKVIYNGSMPNTLQGGGFSPR